MDFYHIRLYFQTWQLLMDYRSIVSIFMNSRNKGSGGSRSISGNMQLLDFVNGDNLMDLVFGTGPLRTVMLLLQVFSYMSGLLLLFSILKKFCIFQLPFINVNLNKRRQNQRYEEQDTEVYNLRSRDVPRARRGRRIDWANILVDQNNPIYREINEYPPPYFLG